MTGLPFIQSVLRTCGAAALLIAGAAQADTAFEPVSGYNRASLFFRVGMPVGKLLIRTGRGAKSCTGFLVSPRYLITNAHCVIDRRGADGGHGEPGIADHVELRLGYTDKSETGAVYGLVLPQVEMNRDLDYAILEVRGDPAGRFGFLSISVAPPVDNMPLWMIGHPRGRPQQLSRTRCKSAAPAYYRKNRLRHFCATKPGSSGSPVFDAASRQVIALHSAGWPDGKSGLAVPFSVIVPQSPILRALLNPPR